MMTAEPTTPTTTTHMMRKKSGRDSEQKRLSLSLRSSNHRHASCVEQTHNRPDLIRKAKIMNQDDS